MPTIAHALPHYNSYGRNGWDVFAVGHPTAWFATIKAAKDWAKGFGLDLVK